MRNLYLLLSCTMFAISVQAQTTLRYETHALIENHVNEMKITKFADPGIEGKNVIWDFRTLELTRDFTGILDSPNHSKGCIVFPNANAQLEEFGNYFYFKSTKSSIEQHGFMSSTGSMHIIYDEPFVKMKYPFTYGSSYSGSFKGRYLSDSQENGTLIGSYAVIGDASGTLLLPNNMVYENALRVKEVKSYGQQLNKRKYEIETITYRWYVNGHRFPVLVLISNTTIYQDGRSHTSTQAAYNSNALNEVNNPLTVTTERNSSNFEAFPNPYYEKVTLRFNLMQASIINLSVYDVNGRLVKVLVNGVEGAGERLYQFSAKEMNLAAGAYIVKLNVNGEETSKRLLEL
jgi:hypothetical protein